MKESKFVELLNLYVDREISAEDAALLEAEIARNPHRHKVYQQYCRMQRASVLVFDSFRSEQVPSGGLLVEASRNADEKIAQFPSRSRSHGFRWGYAGGLVAAAAAVALVFVGRDRLQEIRSRQSAPVAPMVRPVSVAQTSASRPYTATKSAVAANYRPVFVAKTFDGSSIQPGGLFASQQVQSLDWMKQMQLPPLRSIPAGDFSFGNKGDLKQGLHIMPLGKQVQGKVEMMAFQFQR